MRERRFGLATLGISLDWVFPAWTDASADLSGAGNVELPDGRTFHTSVLWRALKEVVIVAFIKIYCLNSINDANLILWGTPLRKCVNLVILCFHRKTSGFTLIALTKICSGRGRLLSHLDRIDSSKCFPFSPRNCQGVSPSFKRRSMSSITSGNWSNVSIT